MIFLGDIACPDEKIDIFQEWTAKEEIFRDQVIILNLEANIVDNSVERKNLTLYNVSKIADIFPQARKIIVSLANNHMYDYPEKILDTKSYLESKGIGVFGLYEDDDFKPYILELDGIKYAFFGHCWRLYTRTNVNKVNNVRVVDCTYDKFLSAVKEFIDRNPNAKVYCCMHWNYDLESLPFPMQREISRKLIDVGVEGVIGGHSHRPQGMEIYNDKPIAYCMGNFYLPSGIYFNGKLCYPQVSKRTYAVGIFDESFKTIWFSTDNGKEPLVLEKIEEFKEEICNLELSPFIGMTSEEYVTYFSENRTKSLLVPVFKHPYGTSYLLKEVWAIIRVKVIRILKGVIKR